MADTGCVVETLESATRGQGVQSIQIDLKGSDLSRARMLLLYSMYSIEPKEGEPEESQRAQVKYKYHVKCVVLFRSQFSQHC